jgi:excinuclease UvrABC nuclease subunit
MKRPTKIFVHSKDFVRTFPDKPGAYLLTCGEQTYVGVTQNIRQRMFQHLRNKYSKFLEFTPKVLEIVSDFDQAVLNALEQKYINIYKPTLNSDKASKYSSRPCKTFMYP